ncbi:uncharacterized protein BJX67DRAFT_366297 [Aspergillus lucknowensis]|uniref:F-box domain-containing protein n=1 Tax=Aspergillus lucknowensis TaxID=176173 RepID=A0ABR4LDC7_9EURO
MVTIDDMGLCDVPDELLLDIIDHIGWDDPTLSRLSRCNKRLYQTITPILYESVELASHEADKFRSLRYFTNAVACNPSLAQQVKYVCLDGVEWSSRASQTKSDQFTTLDYNDLDDSKFLDIVEGLSIVEEDHKISWLKALAENNPDAIVAVLLVSVPSLERFETFLSSDAVFVSYLLTEVAGRGHNILDNLTQLKAEGEGVDGDTCLLNTMVTIPSLTHLFASNWGPEKWRDCKEIPALGKSSITHLELRCCLLDEYHLAKLLTPCVSLQTFILRRDWGSMFHHQGLLSSSITTALYPLRNTLLWIFLGHRPGWSIEDEEDEINPLDFSEFHSLSRLCVAAGYIIKDPSRKSLGDYRHCDPETAITNTNRPLEDRLPSSLEELRIMGPSTPAQVHYLMDSLCQLVRNRAVVPQLKRLCIEAPFNDKSHGFDTTALLEEALMAGIEVVKYHDTYEVREGRWTYSRQEYDWGFDGEFEWGVPVEDGKLYKIE